MISVVIPCFNEQEVLPALVARLRPVLDGIGEAYEVVLVDDGSTDGTAAALTHLSTVWPQVRALLLASNVGHQHALTAGLDRSTGDFVVTMDADLQDPPELIPALLAKARQEQVDVVYARRSDRRTDTAFKRRTAGLYYRAMQRFTRVDLERDVGDFRLMSRRVVLALRELPERDRVYRLLVPWLGFPSAVVDHARAAREAGQSKYHLGHMLRLTVSSTTSFTTAPLRVATSLGLISAILSLCAALGTIVAWQLGQTVPGWASLTVLVLFLGAVQLVCIGVLGEYVGRIYQEVQHRPVYRLDREITRDRDVRVE